MQTLIGRLENVEYVDTSRMGNSRYKCTVGGVPVQSAPNSDIAIDIRNLEGREVIATVRELRGKTVFVTIKPRG